MEAKRGNATIQSIIDGEFYSSHIDLNSSNKPGAQATLPFASLAQRGSPGTRKSAFAVASPPISAPTSPQPQSPGSVTVPALSFKPPSASASKLSAAAAAFQPAVPTAKPVSTNFSSFGQASAFGASTTGILPMAKANAVSPPVTSRSPLQPVLASPVTQPQHTRKTSKRSISPTIALGLPTAQRTISFSNAPPIPASGRAMLDKALPQLLDLLFAEPVDRYARHAALDGLASVHADETAVLSAERQTVVKQCSSELLDRALDEFATEKAKYVVAELLDRKCTLRRQLHNWKRQLDKTREIRSERHERSRSFKDLASHLRASPARLERVRGNQAELDLPDLSMLDISVDNEQERQARPVASSSTSSFWRPGTLASHLCFTVDAAFALMAPVELPDWKCIIVVPATDDALAAWYRCKLSLGPDDVGSVHMLRHVRVEFALSTLDSLEEVVGLSYSLAHSIAHSSSQDMRDVGLLLLNTVHEPATAALHKRLADESIYKAGVLHLDWAADSNEAVCPRSQWNQGLC